MFYQSAITMQSLVEIIITVAGVYFLLGFCFAIPFVFTGVQKLDPAAKGAKWRFRLFILPGVCAFWPLLLKRWISGKKEAPLEINEHRRRAQAS